MMLAETCLDRCQAFSSKNHRQCRLKQRPGFSTCLIHRNYYTRWFDTHKGFFTREQLSQRQLHEYIYQLGGRHVIPPESLIRNLSPDMADYWELLVTCTDYPITLNLICLRMCLSEILIELLKTYPSAEHAKTAVERINTFCKDPTSCEMVFGMLIQELILVCMFYEPRFPISRATLQYIFTVCFITPDNWRQMLYSQSFHTVYQLRRDNLLQSELVRSSRVIERFFDPIFPLFLKTFWFKHAYTIRTRLDPLKSELVSVVFSPQRMQTIIDMLGINCLDDM